jgi:hypothetical protein
MYSRGGTGGHAILSVRVRAGRHTNCGESSGGPKGATDGSSSTTSKRAKPMLSRSRSAPRAVGGWSARICFPDSPTVLRSIKGWDSSPTELRSFRYHVSQGNPSGEEVRDGSYSDNRSGGNRCSVAPTATPLRSQAGSELLIWAPTLLVV